MWWTTYVYFSITCNNNLLLFDMFMRKRCRSFWCGYTSINAAQTINLAQIFTGNAQTMTAGGGGILHYIGCDWIPGRMHYWVEDFGLGVERDASYNINCSTNLRGLIPRTYREGVCKERFFPEEHSPGILSNSSFRIVCGRVDGV